MAAPEARCFSLGVQAESARAKAATARRERIFFIDFSSVRASVWRGRRHSLPVFSMTSLYYTDRPLSSGKTASSTRYR